jgi:membrane-associated phospholipid phosphatase
MHVAYATVAAGLLAAVVPGPSWRAGGAVMVALIALSTLTLKEHVVLDAVAGLALGGGTLIWWHRGVM